MAEGAERSELSIDITTSAWLRAGRLPRPGEDHRVHVGGAQRFVRRLAHGPAQRFDQVGLAATVRPDHARETRLDHEIGGFNERLETREGVSA